MHVYMNVLEWFVKTLEESIEIKLGTYLAMSSSQIPMLQTMSNEEEAEEVDEEEPFQ